jgi:hypothetical protein
MESNKEILSRLKFIGRVKRGEKINVKHMLVQIDGISTKISRTLWSPDNRTNTIQFLEATVNRAFEIIASYKESKILPERAMCVNIIRDLFQAKIGIANIRDTYIIDTKFSCDTDILIEMIDANIEELKLSNGRQQSIDLN